MLAPDIGMTALFFTILSSRALLMIDGFVLLKNPIALKCYALRPRPSWRLPSFLLDSLGDDDLPQTQLGQETSNDQLIAGEEDVAEKLSLISRINSFLDTPLLDANNLKNEGPVKEVLKDFVRDEPELAQIIFSVCVVLILTALTRLILVH